MKQKLIIGLSVLLLLLAVYLIARDLFSHKPSSSMTAFSGVKDRSMKDIDSSLIGYERIAWYETGLHNLSGIAVDTRNRIYVSGQDQVASFTRGKISASFRIDTASGCLAVSDNLIFVGQGARVACYDTTGHLISRWTPYNQNSYITSVAIAGDFVFAADAMNKRILKYTPEGDFVQEFGKKDSAAGVHGFIIPSLYFDIVRGGFNDLWIANPGRLEVENYTLSGSMRTSWGGESQGNSGFAGCCNPAHFTLLPDGSFVTYEKGVDKIKVFDPTGRFVNFVAAAGSFKGNMDFQLGRNNLVKDMTADGSGNIYILDAYNRVNVFRKKNQQEQTYE